MVCFSSKGVSPQVRSSPSGAVVAGVLPGLARLLVEADAHLGARAYQSVEDALRGLSRE